MTYGQESSFIIKKRNQDLKLYELKSSIKRHLLNFVGRLAVHIRGNLSTQRHT